MKKIINGKRYDTDGAEFLAIAEYGYQGNIDHWREDLYRKRTGEFFLHGYGGPASKYAVAEDNNNWSGGEKIIPLTIEAAQAWAEKNIDADEYEKIFGAVDEDDAKKVVTFSLPLSAIEKVKQEASKTGLSLSEYVANCIKKA